MQSLRVEANVIVQRTGFKYIQACVIPRKYLQNGDRRYKRFFLICWQPYFIINDLLFCTLHTNHNTLAYLFPNRTCDWVHGDLVNVQSPQSLHLCKLMLNLTNDCLILSDVVVNRSPQLAESCQVVVTKVTETPTTISVLELDVDLSEERIHDLCQYEEMAELRTMIRSLCEMFVLFDGLDIDLRAHDLFKDCAISRMHNLSTGTYPSPGIVSPSTDILVRNIRFVQPHSSSDRPELGGMSAIQAAISADVGSSNVLLVGPSGCGKTSLVRIVAAALDTNLFSLQAAPSQVPGENALLRRVDKIMRLSRITNRPSIVLVEDVERFCPKGASDRRPTADVAGQEMLLGLDRLSKADNITVICTTRNVEAVGPKLRRPGRVDKEVYIKVPNAEQRREIVRVLLDAFQFQSTDTSLIDFITSRTPAFLGGDLLALLREAKRTSSGGAISEMSISLALQSVRPVSVKTNSFLVERDLSFRLGSLGGLRHLKGTLDMAIFRPLAHPERFQRFGLRLPKGILMYGPPGCAKTTVAKCLANEMHRHLIAVSAAQVYSPYVGDSEQLLAQIFHQARMCAPSIIFIDEIGEHSNDWVLCPATSESDGLPRLSRFHCRLPVHEPERGRRCADEAAVYAAHRNGRGGPEGAVQSQPREPHSHHRGHESTGPD